MFYNFTSNYLNYKVYLSPTIKCFFTKMNQNGILGKRVVLLLQNNVSYIKKFNPRILKTALAR